jgi:hypothetical protein
MVNRVRLYAKTHSLAATWLFFAGVFVNEAIRGLAGNTAARAAAVALIRPSARPAELHAGGRFIPA